MKHLYIFTLIIYSASFAQIPTNYYDSADGLSGYALKTELRNIITNDHQDQGYGALYTGYITTYSDNITESGYENDNTILLFYTENPNGVDPYTFNHGSNQCGNYNGEGVCYNREHLIPQSSFNSASPMQNDIHHVIPSDGFVNGQRGSLPFGTVGSANWTSQNGSKRGSSNVSGYSGLVFEPIDEYKGDIARAILYFVTRYQNTVDNYTSFVMFNGTENQALQQWAIDMLLDWHYNIDPVDAREIARNNAAYNFQGNANPFVSHPEYANLIWNPNQDTENPTNPTNLLASNPTDNSVDLNWTAATDNVAVASYDIYVDGTLAFNTVNTSFTVTGLTTDTNYCFSIKAKDTSGNESGFSNQACEATTNNGSGNSECVSETFELIPSNSASYSSHNWTGDNGLTWSATDARTDQTLNGRAITIRNGNLISPTVSGGIGNLTVTTQLIFSGSSGTFDVKVNGTSVGSISYSTDEQTTTISGIDIEGNVTIVFDSNSTSSNRVRFDDLSWTCYSSLTTEEFSIEAIKIHPNPVNSSLNIDLKNNTKTQIEIYDILGKRILNQTINTSRNFDLKNLKTGVYILKISQNNTSITKRLIKH